MRWLGKTGRSNVISSEYDTRIKSAYLDLRISVLIDEVEDKIGEWKDILSLLEKKLEKLKDIELKINQL